MSERVFGLNGVADKRYYYFVVLKGGGMAPSILWRKLSELGEIERPGASLPFESARFKFEHRKLRLEKAYARGDAALVLSESGKGRPPFLYDLFAARLELSDSTCLLMGFPFAALAREAVDHLISGDFLRTREFQGVEMSELLSEENRPLKVLEGLSSSVVGVEFVVTDDKSLTAVRLGGADPFQAQIYQSFLKEKFQLGLWVPEQCVLACERQPDANDNGSRTPPANLLRSRVHMDTSGNFKFWMQAGCRNIMLMPYVIAQIDATACLKKVNGNPLRRIEQEDRG